MLNITKAPAVPVIRRCVINHGITSPPSFTWTNRWSTSSESDHGGISTIVRTRARIATTAEARVSATSYATCSTAAIGATIRDTGSARGMDTGVATGRLAGMGTDVDMVADTGGSSVGAPDEFPIRPRGASLWSGGLDVGSLVCRQHEGVRRLRADADGFRRS